MHGHEGAEEQAIQDCDVIQREDPESHRRQSELEKPSQLHKGREGRVGVGRLSALFLP